MPGAAVVVIADNQVVFSEGFGLADVTSKTAVTPKTRFRIGSLVKMLTAASIVSLALETEPKIALQSPVGLHLPDLPERLGALTFDQLMRHQAGLVDRIGAQPLTAKDFMTEPERIFSYSSPGYGLAGHAAAAAIELPFEELLAHTLLKKLGMDSTGYAPSPATDAVGYRAREGRAVRTAFMNRPGLEPAGFAWSTAEDLSRFALAFMGGALDPRVVAAMSAPRAFVPGETRRYGYGALIDLQGDDTVIYHMGDEPGGSSFLKMVPAKKCAAIVLTNLMGRMPESMDAALRLAGDVKAVENDNAEGTALTESDIAELVGEYDNASGLRISRKGRSAILSPPLPWYLGWLPLKRELVKYGPDRYGIVVPPSVSPEPIRIAAVRSEGGEIDYLFIRGRAYKRTK